MINPEKTIFFSSVLVIKKILKRIEIVHGLLIFARCYIR